MPDIEVHRNGGEKAHQPVVQKFLEQPWHVGRRKHPSHQRQRHRQAHLHLGEMKRMLPARAGRRLRPEDGGHGRQTAHEHRRARPSRQPPPRGRQTRPAPSQAQICHRAQHAQSVDIQIGGHLIDEHPRVLGKARHAQPPGPAHQRHCAQRERGLFLRRPGQERKDEVKLHLHRQRPQRAVERGVEIRLGPEHEREGQMRGNIVRHLAGVEIRSLRQCEQPQRQQHRRQIGRHDAQQAVEVKPPHRRDRGPLLRLTRIGQIEQKAAEQDHPVHKQIGGSDKEVQVQRRPKQRHPLQKPALLPDMVMDHRQHHQRPKAVEHPDLQPGPRLLTPRRHPRPPRRRPAPATSTRLRG